MVGPGGLEPPTPALSRQCSNQLSYEPVGNADYPVMKKPISVSGEYFDSGVKVKLKEVWPYDLESIGIEPTTSCLQSRRSSN